VGVAHARNDGLGCVMWERQPLPFGSDRNIHTFCEPCAHMLYIPTKLSVFFFQSLSEDACCVCELYSSSDLYTYSHP
jgi:hypothetical protein